MSDGAGSSRPLSYEYVDGDPALLSVDGDLDLSNAGELMRAVPDDCVGLVIDLGGVPFMDSTGLRALVLGIQRLQRVGVRVAVAAPSEQVARMFELTAVDRILDLHATVASGRLALTPT